MWGLGRVCCEGGGGPEAWCCLGFIPISTVYVCLYSKPSGPCCHSNITTTTITSHQARYACELMASRGVRVARDVTAEWSNVSRKLVERVEAYERKVGGSLRVRARARACVCVFARWGAKGKGRDNG